MSERLKQKMPCLMKRVVQKIGKRVDQKRMRWIEAHASGKKHTFHQCSHCQGYFSSETPFCPNCGKPMGIDEGIFLNDAEGHS